MCLRRASKTVLLPFASAAGNKCSSCRLVYYCSQEHQREHWKYHKESCAVWTKNRLAKEKVERKLHKKKLKKQQKKL